MCDQPGRPAEQTLAELLARVRAGDEAAARELVSGVTPIVTRIARAHPLRRMSEEDVSQEVLIKMFARLDQYRGDAPFEHWVSRIAVSTCIDLLRFECRRPELRWSDLPECEAGVLEALHRDPRGAIPGEDFGTRELLERLMRRLRPEDRNVIAWFELEERTIAEIQVLTGWNFNFVKMRLFRARRKLQRFFAELPGHDGPGTGARKPSWLRGRGKGRGRDQPANPNRARARSRGSESPRRGSVRRPHARRMRRAAAGATPG